MATQSHAKPRTTPPKPKADESILDSIHNSQELAVNLAKEVVDSVGEIVPDLWTKPVASGVPAIQEITDAAFTLTRGILDAQRDFTKRIVGSVVDEVKKFH